MSIRELILIFSICTAYNVLFDWYANRLGAPTIAYEGGILITLTTVWLLGVHKDHRRFIDHKKNSFHETVKRVLKKHE